jgi:hypothetical protein
MPGARAPGEAEAASSRHRPLRPDDGSKLSAGSLTRPRAIPGARAPEAVRPQMAPASQAPLSKWVLSPFGEGPGGRAGCSCDPASQQPREHTYVVPLWDALLRGPPRRLHGLNAISKTPEVCQDTSGVPAPGRIGKRSSSWMPNASGHGASCQGHDRSSSRRAPTELVPRRRGVACPALVGPEAGLPAFHYPLADGLGGVAER